MNNNPNKVWQEYQRIQEYLTRRNVYETVKTNENFYEGKQWEGVKTENMPKPVVNILQRVVKYMIATLSSNEVAVSITPFSESSDDIDKMKPIAEEVEKVIERAKIKEASKLSIRNAAVDGAAYMMQTFDPDYETGQDIKGCIENMVIDNTNMYFGNPYSSDIQKQPFIIVALRQFVGQVKEEARELGVREEDIEQIRPDTDSNLANDDSDDLCTVLLKFYKKKTRIKETVIDIDEFGAETEVEIETDRTENTVWFTKTTEKVTLIEPTDLGYTRYPIACFGWDPIKNSYLYTSPITAVIPNQIFINKCFAIAQMYGQQSAFPKIVYDKSKVDIEKLLNSTNPNAVVGIDMMGKFLDFIKIPDFSNNILDLLDATITQTKECMGVNDASLGNVSPDNTSAIIALQEASNVPLELQRQGFYQFWEDTVRNIIDIMANTYGTRLVVTDVDGQKTLASVDFSMLKDLNFEVNVDIGEGAQFSEIAQINTLDKLFQAEVIDAKTYIDSIPSKYIPNKGKISQYVDEKAKQQQALLEQQMMMQNTGNEIQV